jgi:predicted nuclease of predicted toxin-antitoxin system
MTIWVDAQLSPSIALWMNLNFPDIEAKSLRSIGLRDAMDQEIFERGKLENVVIMTKDSDFVGLLQRFGPPPKVILVTSGNTSNSRMKKILSNSLEKALNFLKKGESLVELKG